MNLELRRKTLEACGWTFVIERKQPKYCDIVRGVDPSSGKPPLYQVIDSDRRRKPEKADADAINAMVSKCPAIDTDTGIAVDALVKWCEANEYHFVIGDNPPHDALRIDCEIVHSKKQNYIGQGATIAEAICLAICAAGGAK